MLEINPIIQQIKSMQERCQILRGYLDVDAKKERLLEVERELENPELWNTPERAQALGKERVELAQVVDGLVDLINGLKDCEELLEIANDERDVDTVNVIMGDLHQYEAHLAQLEFQRMFSGEMDANNAFLDVQAGSGGVEAQDWAAMLMRMYLRWGERRGFAPELLDVADAEVAGIRGATIKFTGPYAYGWLRTETGVHRLVRKSPFDANHKRHTSFASVFVRPEVDDSIDIDINPADLRVDTYRASGAGGQHVNRTESAIRITHIPSGIVTQSQADRSQHQNRSHAMAQLKAKLYELEMQKRNSERQKLEDQKSDIGWGSQIRSYVLDQSRIKDLRTGVETGNTQAVLDGDLDQFLEASLKSGLANNTLTSNIEDDEQ
ncbi:MAG: peptide chain release factor 2 [Gammaproteobacteria bacterium]|nr:peptide chain release factor 2 [Gammaproteobacteria bacterium]